MSALTEYNPTEAALADLRQRYADVAFDLTTTKGDKEARAARKELVTLRTSLEAKRKELKAPALERAKLIDTEAKRIEAAILELEEPIDAQIKADEARRERERLLHGREILQAFVESYGSDPEFAAIVPALRKFLQPAMQEAA